MSAQKDGLLGVTKEKPAGAEVVAAPKAPVSDLGVIIEVRFREGITWGSGVLNYIQVADPTNKQQRLQSSMNKLVVEAISWHPTGGILVTTSKGKKFVVPQDRIDNITIKD